MTEQVIPPGMSLADALDFPMELIEARIKGFAEEGLSARAERDWNRIRVLDYHLNKWKGFYNWRKMEDAKAAQSE